MTVEKFQIEQILKTLPIGYYAKRNIEVTLDDSATSSYYIPMEDKIVISTEQLLPVLVKHSTEENLESDIRTMLYHEVSHAILTPKHIKVTDYLNIVEDERIETILRKFYLNVDFRSFVKRVNDFHDEAPTTGDQAFYQLVRFRIGTERWLSKLHDLLLKYKDINRESYYYGYEKDVRKFYEEFIKEWTDERKKDAAEDNKEESTEETESKQSESKNFSAEKDDEKTEETLKSASKMAGSSDEDEKDADIYSDADKIFTSQINRMYDKSMNEQIQKIFSKVLASTKRNGSSINSYSGIFDPRSVARDDYKYFTQKNRMGHLKMHSKIHLNLFIDRSGSFNCSQDTVNKLLKALVEFEKINDDFTFDLVTIGMYEKLHAKNDRVLKCAGGNRVTTKIHDIVKKLQLTTATNYNIVLFDGDAVSDSGYARTEDKNNFKAFNANNFTIISNEENESIINTKCKNAKKIITTKYAAELKENVFKALDQLVR